MWNRKNDLSSSELLYPNHPPMTPENDIVINVRKTDLDELRYGTLHSSMHSISIPDRTIGLSAPLYAQ